MKVAFKRLAAYWLDFAVLAAVLVGLQWAVYRATGGFPFDRLDRGFEIEAWVLGSMSLPVWAYFIVCETWRRQTLGKRLLRLEVVTAEHGTSIGLPRALGRTLIRLLPWEATHLIILVPEPWWDVEQPPHPYLIYLPNALMVLYAVVLFATKGRMAIHDYAMRTRVKERA
ncbi:RDD family protein [Paenibacillus sp. MWE-103]|uniref:RDD family protein n=2 Tax=Paenibacillus artemisiicola TaxID=1172618 RepID=A0ABS3WJM3_9BACL|nr:RDD family protein [Paenibacillus artemisiicola]